ncbi:uncharacterized protein LOC132600606 [Lycium barbarum]|uniref:uncharacterized protein LOC132600606 n=1 Tax=Lycium barbarum TaxID=112863 RepID=UPI00293EEA4A|nr:uncharacterized protein LOC132600606 [Lycium barbarum]XP_060169885.1 uncharacterized protein LOC132600606 [Lycium barbarum]XP_060169893.1 uncharacterized protein LOC132600606 [Lycium barbarum]XP_060169902.1 uncharacterized protein LOC132600606 [Lycium barbarum]
MTTTSYSKLSMKLLIDTNAGKVLFAEADKDCVDFLFQILSLPAGTVMSLLKEKGMSGSLPNLYESVENLKDVYIQSNQCKDILLKPKSSVGISSAPFLLLNYDDLTREKTFYGCSYTTSHSTVSDDPSALCTSCRHSMSRKFTYVAPPVANGAVAATGGFVKDLVTYMVTDDLVVTPMSSISCISLLNKFNVRDVGVLEEEVVSFGMNEALELLKASFESKEVLTSVFTSCVKVEK